MVRKMFIPLVIGIAFLGTRLFSEEKLPQLKVGEDLFVTLSGAAAQEYANLTGFSKGKPIASDITFSVPATVEWIHKSGRELRFGNFQTLTSNGPTKRMLEVSAVVNSADVKTEITPKGTAIYGFPGDPKPVITPEDSESYTLACSSTKGLTFRVWKLEKEVSEQSSTPEAERLKNAK